MSRTCPGHYQLSMTVCRSHAPGEDQVGKSKIGANQLDSKSSDFIALVFGESNNLLAVFHLILHPIQPKMQCDVSYRTIDKFEVEQILFLRLMLPPCQGNLLGISHCRSPSAFEIRGNPSEA